MSLLPPAAPLSHSHCHPVIPTRSPFPFPAPLLSPNLISRWLFTSIALAAGLGWVRFVVPKVVSLNMREKMRVHAHFVCRGVAAPFCLSLSLCHRPKSQRNGTKGGKRSRRAPSYHIRGEMNDFTPPTILKTPTRRFQTPNDEPEIHAQKGVRAPPSLPTATATAAAQQAESSRPWWLRCGWATAGGGVVVFGVDFGSLT